MVDIRAFRGRLVSSEWLNRVPSPAYDSLSTEQRRAFRANNHWSYLNVTRAPEDEATGAPIDNASLVAAATVVLNGLIAEGAFGETDESSMYLYRLAAGDHLQTGIVAEAAVADYVNGGILAHEQIRQARADLLADHVVGVGHTSSPIALTFESNETIRNLIRAGRNEHPVLDWNDGTLHQTVWRLSDEHAEALSAALAPLTAYIIDGHHRAAAAVTVAARDDAPIEAGRMLVALFPDKALQLLSFHRWVRGLTPDVVSELLRTLGERFSLMPADDEGEPVRGTMGVYAAGQRYTLSLGQPSTTDPLSVLDPVRLQNEVLSPLLGIVEAGADDRLVTVSGDQSIASLEESVDVEGGVAFIVPPLETGDLFAVANAGMTMPPKSTYFVPKVRSGIFLRPVNAAS